MFIADKNPSDLKVKYVLKKFTVVNDGNGALTFTDGQTVYKNQDSSQ